MGAHFSRSLREVGFLTGGTPRDVGAPSLRFLQEPALSLPKGRVPRTLAVTLSTRLDPKCNFSCNVRSTDKVQMMHPASAMEAVRHN